MAARAEEAGVGKAGLDLITTFVLAVLAGAFIALGAMFATTVTAGTAGALPFGIVRLLAGGVFSLGLVLVIVGGAELFTGNALLVMAWAAGRLPLTRLLRNWAIVFTGNFAGALLTAGVMVVAGQYQFGDGAVGAAALATAAAKLDLGPLEAVALGVLGNGLVCLAVWLTLSARTTGDRILAIVFPIAAFVTAGFEHSVANMYFVPVALFIRDVAPPAFWQAIGQPAGDYASLTWMGFLARNLLPVTAGNIIGGTVLVGVPYWFVYRRRPHPRD